MDNPAHNIEYPEKQLMKILNPSFLALCLFVLGGMIFKSISPTGCAPILPNDNIFVLSGDVRRIPFAMHQLQMHPDTDLYIIGAGANITTLDTTRNINIESDSKSTYQNALAIRDIATNADMNRIVIITTEDHMNRSLYLIRHELPGIEVVACPVTLRGMPPAKRLERWTIEYIKYIVTMFGIKES